MSGSKVGFRCNFEDCTRTYEQKQYLTRHINVVHKQSNIKCNLCGTRFSNPSSLETHNYKFHRGDKGCKEYVTQLRKEKDKKRRDETLFECPEQCGKSFLSKNGVSHHKLLAHTPKEAWPFTCPFCKMKLTQKSDKERHMKLKNHKNHIGVSMPEIGSQEWNDLLDQEAQKSPKIKNEKVSHIKTETEIENRISSNRNNSEQPIDSPKDHMKIDKDKVMINIKQENVAENYEALREENNDPLSAIVDRIDNNEDITIDEMLTAIEKICAS